MDPPRATIQATGARGHGILSVSLRPADMASPSRASGWPVPSPRPTLKALAAPKETLVTVTWEPVGAPVIKETSLIPRDDTL